ncbi:MAG: CpaD family pilus assembly protein [Hyphomicrobium sp.]
MMSKTKYPRDLAASRMGGFKVLAMAAATLALAGCKHAGDGTQVAGWSLVDPQQRHPIMVSQQPAHLNVHVSRGSSGLDPAERAEVMQFSNRYRAADSGNSRLVIQAPSGSPNEVAAMNAVSEIRDLLMDSGFDESSIVVEAFNDESNNEPPVRISYMRYVAEAPECGHDWSENLARNVGNTSYPNFGCAGQRNLAAMVANPADLLGPRSEGTRHSERRDAVFRKYSQGETTTSQRSEDEKVKTGKDN